MSTGSVTLEVGVVPAAKSGYERFKKYRDAGKEKPRLRAQYLARPFRTWDGEGMTFPGEEKQRYTLFATYCQGSYEHIEDVNGLTTEDILDFILEVGAEDHRLKVNPINVIYGGSYDANMWLEALDNDEDDRRELRALVKQGGLTWDNYRLSWRQRKSFRVQRVGFDRKRIGKGVLIYDVSPFFQCSFVAAMDDYFNGDWPGRNIVVENKAKRGTFDLEMSDQVFEYCKQELILLEQLCIELRSRLDRAELRPKRWDGPGAVAATLFQAHEIKKHMADVPQGPAKAARYAYAGGRFETLQFGDVEAPAYEYDLSSAYPAAMRELPSLAGGRWFRTKEVVPFGVYKLTWSADNANTPGPLFRRMPRGDVCYPMLGTGWYWTPEVQAVIDCAEAGRWDVRIVDGWGFDPFSEYKPFWFVDDLYHARQTLRAAGDGAHVAYKLALNSMYGKTAQQVGWRTDQTRGLILPPYHQLEWAGYTTSWCRAEVLRAAMQAPESVIAFETDALFTSEPLVLPISDKLGEWKDKTFSRLTYAQSGVYFADGKEKTRGSDRGVMHREDMIRAMQRPLADERFCSVPLTRFNGAGVALTRGLHRWRIWETATRRYSAEPNGKRIHLCDYKCVNEEGLELGVWHKTVCPVGTYGHSCEYPVEWVNPDPQMDQLSELRRRDDDYDIIIDSFD